MPRMINPIMAAIAVFLSAALFTCSGCAIISQIAAAMPTSRTASPSSTPAVSSAPATRFYTGDGGRGIRLAVLVPTAANLASDQNYLPTMVQGELVTNLSSYSAISVLDRLRLETVLKETESGIYKNEEDFGRLGEIANVDYVLTGSITRTSTGHTLQLQIVGTGGDTIGVTRAAYSGTPTVAEMDNFTGIRRASLELLAQMGVTLTDAARNELSGAASADRVNAQTSLAQGIIAQRGGTEIAALSYFFQAAAIDPSLAEAANRSSILAANISSGNIGEDVRNEIQWRRDWIARLTETEQYFNDFFGSFFRSNSMPYTLYYSMEIERGEINFQNETTTLSILTYLRASPEWGKSVEPVLRAMQAVVQTVYDGLNATERKATWGLDNWPQQGTFNQRLFGRKEGSFSVTAELVNSRDQVIGRQTIQAHLTYTIPVPLPGREANITFDRGHWQLVSFNNVRANDITDSLTIRITSVNGVDAETAARNDVLQIIAIPPDKGLFRTYIGFDLMNIDIWDQPVIGEGEFAENQLTSVTIPNNVVAIGRWAFGLNELTNVTIPNSVVYIGDGAFFSNHLTSVTIPNSVVYIGGGAFLGNHLTLTSITIGANVSMQNDSFDNGFPDFYNRNGKRAGTYTYRNNSWSYSAR